ncbi:hypothetical protein T265_04605 [Opisthorchis viverrini]|uniref:Uncharacterized protein n=1 Tax=Opisthorchis viverrini TaxID=6198 RepID=A0A074ZN54_OPIVI|nr:hypothetical protein T265_04605 [Opisthorchis viverrini]KER28556.1 hypothetical protein T265_04605 [Opisthorchis viverrini]
MDPLVPKFSPYELDYTTDIQQKMRVPDKISYDSDKSIIATEDEPIALRNYTVADLVLDVNNPSVKSPGFSPDLLNNSDVRGSTFARGARWPKLLESEFTDWKVRGSNPTSASRFPLSRLGQSGSIPALLQPSGGVAARHRKAELRRLQVFDNRCLRTMPRVG